MRKSWPLKQNMKSQRQKEAVPLEGMELVSGDLTEVSRSVGSQSCTSSERSDDPDASSAGGLGRREGQLAQ